EAGFLPRQAIERSAVMGELAMALAPGPLWRRDRGNRIVVRPYGGPLSSAPAAALMNGANPAATGAEGAGYEIVQFRLATMIDETTWECAELLRGQGGTGDIMAAGHAAGARFVLLDAAVVALALNEAEAGLGLTLRAGAAGTVYDPEDFVD